MSAIDNLLASKLIRDLSFSFAGSISPTRRKVPVPFAALELAAQQTATNEDEIEAIIDALILAKGWSAKVDYISRMVIFYV